jgi:hypothetical protein
MANQLSSSGKYLHDRLRSLKQSSKRRQTGKIINVGGVGGVVSAAYEQLRNAAEYTQEHLLRQRAMRRFYGRNISFVLKKDVDKSIGEELIIELTQAGYIENDSLTYDTVAVIYEKTKELHATYWRLRDIGVDRVRAERWILDALSVETEGLIDQDQQTKIFLQFAFMHYKETLDKKRFIKEKSDNSQYEASLYIAVHRSLLKSDLANVRADLIQLYNTKPSATKSFRSFNETVDEMFSSALSDRLTKHISKYGAPLRVLRSMTQETTNVPELMDDKKRFLFAYESQVEHEYNKANVKLNNGLVKSIIFLLLTKSLIGLFIEIPYDIIVVGSIAVLPLIINLLFPVVYLVVLRLGLKTPGTANTKALVAYTDEMLYKDSERAVLHAKNRSESYPLGYTVLFGLMFVITFAIVITLLINWDFNIVQGVIFFIFLATASFLGFRLSRIIRKLELVTTKSGMIAIIRDFLYFPFIVLGQKISERYEQINIVSQILDTVIELPLKTVLRLLRQWSSFLNDQKDRL